MTVSQFIQRSVQESTGLPWKIDNIKEFNEHKVEFHWIIWVGSIILRAESQLYSPCKLEHIHLEDTTPESQLELLHLAMKGANADAAQNESRKTM